MNKTIFLTGATDGIGFETAKMLAPMGHTLLLHGRNEAKLDHVINSISKIGGCGKIEGYIADLSSMTAVAKLATVVAEQQNKIDILINNAGVYGGTDGPTEDGLDVRFAVNTLAPYLLTRKMLPLMDSTGRVINLSSAAQASIAPQAFRGERPIASNNLAYAQSKLALTMWSIYLAGALGESGPVIIAVNPMSMLGSKMVREAYGVEGADLRIGADILCRAAFSDEFAQASGKYFDNDIRQFSSPHPDALHPGKCADIVATIETILAEKVE